MSGNLILGNREADGVSAPYVYGDAVVETARTHDTTGRPATMAAKESIGFWGFLASIGLIFFNRWAISKDIEKTQIIERTELERIHARLRAETAAYETRLRETMVLAEHEALRLGDTNFHDVQARSWSVSESRDKSTGSPEWEDFSTPGGNGFHPNGSRAPQRRSGSGTDPFDTDLPPVNGHWE